jgi:hypothetical protein
MALFLVRSERFLNINEQLSFPDHRMDAHQDRQFEEKQDTRWQHIDVAFSGRRN